MNGLSSHEWHGNESPVHGRVKELEKQREVLLETLESLCDRIYDEGCTPLDWPEYYSSRAAIASVKESK
jgi:hypothetical protein